MTWSMSQSLMRRGMRYRDDVSVADGLWGNVQFAASHRLEVHCKHVKASLSACFLTVAAVFMTVASL